MSKVVNTYSGGLDQDISKTKYPNNKYFDALDISIVADGNQSQFSVTNERGNKFLVDIPQLTLNKLIQQFSYLNINGTTSVVNYTNTSINALVTGVSITATYNPVIIGYCVVRDQVILFTTDVNQNSTDYNTGGVGQIWSLKYNQSTFVATSLDLLYCHNLKFTTKHPIYDEARGRYENPNVIKVYWTDNHNYFRHVNIADANLINTEPNDLDIISDITLSEPSLLNVLQGGNFLNGEAQYAYNLYNLYGSESTVSPLSPLYSLSPTFKKGGVKGGLSGKSLEVEISSIDTDFDYIKVYRIYYDDFFQQPLIHLIKEEPIPTNGVYSFIDDGSNSITQLSLEEFQFISTEPFYCKSIETKDNFMFPANIRKGKFDVDWDAKAYRFPINSNATTVVNNGVNITVTTGSNISETDDAINPNDLNSLFNDPVNNIYKYQRNSTILGGTGPNVTYQFKLEAIVGDDSGYTSSPGNRNLSVSATGAITTLAPENNQVKTYGSPFINGKMRSFKRDETYRFGIVFFNSKGQESFVKWIGDIRMPAISETDGQVTIPNSGGLTDFRLSRFSQNITTLYTLYPEFTFSNIPTDQDIIGAKVVFVKRENKDKTITAQGIVTPTLYNFNDPNTQTPNVYMYNADHYTKTSASFSLNTQYGSVGDSILTETNGPSGNMLQTRTDLVQFLTPETNYLKNINYKQGNYFLTAGLYTTYAQSTIQSSSGVELSNYNTTFSNYTSKERLTKMIDLLPLNLANNYQKIPLKDGKIVGFGYGSIEQIGDIPYRNYFFLNGTWHNDEDFLAYGGTSFLANLRDAANNNSYNTVSGVSNIAGYPQPRSISGVTPDGFILADYKQNINNQYGGNTYSSRTLNTYRPASSYFPITSGTTTYTINASQGDTFISYFDYLRLLWDDQVCTSSGIYSGGTPNHTIQEVLYFPVETQVNLNLTHGSKYSETHENTLLETVEAGTNVGNVTGTCSGVYNPTLEDMYLYNIVYSKENDFIEYFPKPLNSPDQEEFDCRVLHSEQKFNGESIDKWTKYLANNFIDVDAPYGPINRVIMINDEIAFVQTNGFGLIAINPRVQVQGDDGVAIELGKGGILHDFKYISKEYGSIHQFGINSSNTALYIPDTNRQKIIISNPQTGLLSDIKGLHKYLRKNLINNIITQHNPIEGVGVISVFDKLNNRMLFTFIDRASDNSRPPVYSSLNSYTIGYNELLQSFESFYSFKPNLYIKDRRRILSTDTTLKKLYTHSEGTYGVFYDQAATNAKITLIINPAQNSTFEFTNLSWLSELLDTNDADVFNETLTSLRITNDYQDTGLITLVNPVNLRRLMREWHYQIPRDILSINQKARIRNPYIKLELFYQNNLNKKLILSDIVTDVIN